MSAADERVVQSEAITIPDSLQEPACVDLKLEVGSSSATTQAPISLESAEPQAPTAEQTLATVDITPFAELSVGADVAFELLTASATTRVQATIVHVYQPYTMSAVLRVQIDQAQTADLPPEAILKLYDRRFLNNVREELSPPSPWSHERDDEYSQWLRDLADGKVQAVDFDADSESVWTYADLSAGCLEGFLQHTALRMHSREVHAYGVLAELQGNLIPRLYGTVVYQDTSTPVHAVPGILIEYVPGPTLRQLVATWAERAPRPPDAELANICEAAVDAVERVAQCDALINPDIRIDNVIFRGFDETEARSPVVIIDFTEVFTRDGESDEEWRQTKVDNDEVGAIGKPLTVKVATQVGLGIWTYSKILPITASQLGR